MPFSSLATVEVQLCMQMCHAKELLALARCNKHMLYTASSSDFAWTLADSKGYLHLHKRCSICSMHGFTFVPRSVCRHRQFEASKNRAWLTHKREDWLKYAQRCRNRDDTEECDAGIAGVEGYELDIQRLQKRTMTEIAKDEVRIMRNREKEHAYSLVRCTCDLFSMRCDCGYNERKRLLIARYGK